MTRRSWLCTLGLAVLAGCGAMEPGTVPSADIPDPTTLERTGWPNDWLLCPPGSCTAEISAASPALSGAGRPPRTRPGARCWRRNPASRSVATDEPRLLILAQDRTAVLRFVDTISIRVLPAPAGGSTFAAYSRSNLGFGDLGTNRRRLEAWTAALDGIVGGS